MDVSSHSLFLLQQLNVQREFGFLCDCTVAIGNVYFKAHRAVLAAFSNYFKMIFIHQSSECIKIQPTDIQPDVFSYLLHIMYTGMGPKQPVDKSRLQEGIKFLHAYQLCRKPGDTGPDVTTDVRMSNLYGIQISSQLPNKDGTGPKGGSQRDSEGSRSSGRGDWAGRSQARPSQAVGLEGVSSDHQTLPGLRPQSSATSGEELDMAARIKEEHLDEDEQQEREDGEKASVLLPMSAGALSPSQGNPPCPPGLSLLCPRCGERCLSPEGLQEHLISHAACSLDPLMEATPAEDIHLEGGVGVLGAGSGVAMEHRSMGDRLDAGCLEEALRQSQVLADEIAAELRRSGGATGSVGVGVGIGGFTVSPPMVGLFTRKRKLACSMCSQRFPHKSQLQEHMLSHVGKPARHPHLQSSQRYGRFCNQLLQAACEGAADGTQGVGTGMGVGLGEASTEEGGAREAQDNGSSCYSLDSEVSRESADAVAVE